MTKIQLIVFAGVSIALAGCSTSARDHESQENSLKGVYDSKYSLQLKPADERGHYRFEICLKKRDGTPTKSCVSALRTQTGDDFTLTIKNISEFSLTEYEKTALLKTHEEYLAYQQSLQQRHNDVVMALGVSSGITIGGAWAARTAHHVSQKHQKQAIQFVHKAQSDKTNYLKQSAKRTSTLETAWIMEIQDMLTQIKGDQDALKSLSKEKIHQANLLQGLQDELLSYRHKNLSIHDKHLIGMEESQQSITKLMTQFQAAGLRIDKAPQALISAQDLGGRTTLLSDKFLKFVLQDLGAESSEDLRRALGQSFGLQPTKINPHLYKKWIADGGQITEIFESDFLLSKIFEYNKIENALFNQTKVMNGPSTRLAPENIHELTQAFEANDFRFFHTSHEFVENLGRSPKAMTLYNELQDLNALIAVHYESTMNDLIEKSQNKIASIDDQAQIIGQRINQLYTDITNKVQGMQSSRKKEIHALNSMVTKANRMMNNAQITKKYAPTLVIVMTGAMIVGVIHFFTKEHVEARLNVQDILSQHNELNALISYGSPLLLVDDKVHESVSSVETILINFAKWQALVAPESSVVGHTICLPQPNTAQDGATEAMCKTIDL